ncbi:hypothetical protein D3C72_2434400 [compost metagenome]
MDEGRLISFHTGNFLVHDRSNLGTEELNGTKGFSVRQCADIDMQEEPIQTKVFA